MTKCKICGVTLNRKNNTQMGFRVGTSGLVWYCDNCNPKNYFNMEGNKI